MKSFNRKYPCTKASMVVLLCMDGATIVDAPRFESVVRSTA